MHYKWSGKKVKCEGLTVQLTKVLSERNVENLGEWVVVADGKPEGVDSPVVVRLRVQLDLETVDDHDRRVALKAAAIEYAALVDLVDSGHTPRCLAFGKMLQDQSWPYPGGYIHVLVMSKVSGRNVQQVLFDLTEGERAIIRVQLTSVLEWAKPKRLNLDITQIANYFRYLIDLEAVVYLGEDAGDIITPESSVVELFGVWNEYAYRDDSLPCKLQRPTPPSSTIALGSAKDTGQRSS